MADTGLATRLRAAGLEVREVKGWKTRGRDFAGTSPSFNPIGGVNHHTAGHPTKANPTPSLGIVIHGRPDLSGPLCNVLLGFDGIFYVVAAGVANHAGLPDGGSIKGMTGNSSAYGLEIEHDGLHPLPDDIFHIACRGWAAIFRGKAIKATQLVQHKEWAPSRKIDLATGPQPDNWRMMVAREINRQAQVKRWTASFKDAKGDRIENESGDPQNWVGQHPGAFQRGKVIFTPIRS